MENNVQKPTVEELLAEYANIFDIEQILSIHGTDNLTDQERYLLLSLPGAMLNYANNLSNLMRWLIQYHTLADKRFVTDTELLVNIQEVEAFRADLMNYASECIRKCHGYGIPNHPANKPI